MYANPVQSINPVGPPMKVLYEGRTQSKGRPAMENNITAARMICSIIRTSLGPHGMDKMLISDQDVATITNDGATMLKEMRVEHPAGRILIDVAKATDKGVGDGTTSAVVLAGALLEGADELLKRGLHPIVVVSGFRRAAERAVEELEGVAETIDPQDRGALIRVAKTSLRSKIISSNADKVSGIVVDAALDVALRLPNGAYRVDIKSIKVEKKLGGSMAETEMIRGIVLDQKILHPGMPRRMAKARIAFIHRPFEMEQGQYTRQVTIRDPTLVSGFIDAETEMMREKVEKLRSVGANVLICQKKVDEMAKHFLAQAGILAVEKSWEHEAGNIARATGARLVGHVEDLTEADLGYADLVEERRVGPDMMLYVTGTKNPKSITILTRGANMKVAEEAERSIHDAVMVVRDMMQEPSLVAGGGAIEIELARRLAMWADTIEGKEQLPAQKFAEALEQIPMILAQNAGLDTINTLAALRAKHADGPEGKWYGVPASGKKILDMYKEDVLEPTVVKKQVIVSASEAVCMLLRIDNVIALPPQKAVHQGEKERAQAMKEGHRPIAPPSATASRV